jgi:two-component system NtrC family sensor kinase
MTMRNPLRQIGFKPVVTAMGVLTVVLLVVAMLTGLASLRNAQEIVSDDFNRQQLILARSTARQLQEALHQVRRELAALGYSPAIQYLEKVAWANRMRVSMEELVRYGAVEICRCSADGSTRYLLEADGEARVVSEGACPQGLLAWARDPANKGRLYHGQVEVKPRPGGGLVPTKVMAMPIYQVSVDESHPVATGLFDGVVSITLQVDRLVGRYAADIRSGRTGYAWAVSSQGIFLYHPDRDFIGQDAFKARQERNPAISFAKINEIQKTKMLRGEEGTSWYTSGWHRGVIREMTKFLAYSPVELAPGRYWSVAVVAPTDEVAGTVRSLYIRQFFIQGVLIVALVFAAVAVIYYERRWSVELQEEVRRTTADLRLSNTEVRKSEAKYRSVVENARDFIMIVGKAGELQAVNRFAASALGVPAEKLVGAPLADHFSPTDAQTQLKFIHQALEGGHGIESKYELAIQGREYRLSGHFVPLPEEGPADRVLVIARDITDRQRMEDLMFQTEKLASLGKLAAGVAHEINNPVAIILGFAELLLERVPEGSKEHDILKTIERQGLNCKKIVENLLTFARLPEKTEESSDVNQDLEKVLSVVRNTLLTQKIELSVRLDPALPRVRGDSTQLEQVFLNIINNAVAAMPKGGQLTISSQLNPTTNMVEVICTDTGCGIAKEHADKIFDPFFTTKRVGEGTGLGLSVSHAIVSKFGGGISFESRCGGEAGGQGGTTFFISLQPELASQQPVRYQQVR